MFVSLKQFLFFLSREFYYIYAQVFVVHTLSANAMSSLVIAQQLGLLANIYHAASTDHRRPQGRTRPNLTASTDRLGDQVKLCYICREEERYDGTSFQLFATPSRLTNTNSPRDTSPRMDTSM